MIWNRLVLEDACSLVSRGISPKYLEAGGVRVLNQKCIRNHTINFSLARRHDISKKGVKQERFIQKGDVLINSTGHGTLGRVAQVRDEPDEPTTVDSHVTIVRPMDKFFYLDYFGFAAIFIEDEIKAAGQGTSGQTELSKKKLKEEFYVSFPADFAEQERIVAKLDAAFAEIDGAIEVANAKVKEVNCLFKKELENTFSNGEFESVNLEELAKVTSSKRVLKSHYVESGIPFYRTKEIKELANGNPIRTELFISQEQFSEFKNKFGAPQAGDVLITAIGTIGEVYVVQQGDEFYFKDGNILWLRNITGLNSDYLRYSLINFVDELNSLAHGAAYSALPIQRLKSHKIPIKALSEQTSSVVKLDALGKLTQDIDKLNSNKISALGVLKSAILAQELQSEAA